MRTAYLKRREPFEEILFATLSEGWSEQYAAPIRVTPPCTERGRQWLLHPWLNGYCVERPRKAVRLFLRENFRNTPVRYRLPLQWTLGTLLSHPWGLQATGRPGFCVEGPLPGQESLLLVPGNNRLRIFDFRAGTSRVFLKNGFDPGFMRNEIDVRGRQPGPFPRLTAWSEACEWFEEPILSAVPLVRVRSQRRRAYYSRQVLVDLNQWLERSKREVAMAERLAILLDQIDAGLHSLRHRMEGVHREKIRRWCETLADRAVVIGHVSLAASHGDLMRDNILVDEREGRVYLIDWERCAERFYWYDHFVYALNTRLPAGLSHRLKYFLQNGSTHPWLAQMPRSTTWRAAAVALFLLEDLATNVSINARSPYYAVAEDLRLYLIEVDAILKHWQGGSSDSLNHRTLKKRGVKLMRSEQEAPADPS